MGPKKNVQKTMKRRGKHYVTKKQSHNILSRTLELEWKKSKEKKLTRIIKTDD